MGHWNFIMIMRHLKCQRHLLIAEMATTSHGLLLIILFLFIENINKLHLHFSHHLNTISAGFILYRFLVTDVIVRKIDARS